MSIDCERAISEGMIWGCSTLPRQGFHVVDPEHPTEEEILDIYLAREVEIGGENVDRFMNRLSKHAEIVSPEK